MKLIPNSILSMAIVVAPVICSTTRVQAAPAFDCLKAEHEIEDLICQNSELADKDRKLAAVYKQALSALSDVADGAAATRNLKAFQRGWVKGRNGCWKSLDKVRRTHHSYDMRIAELQARYFLIEAAPPVFYECENNPANEIVASFISTDLPSVRLERGDTVKIGLLVQTGSGSKYIADQGTSFWIKGDEAQVSWSEGNDFKCQVRKTE